jgi:hypothetical protein
MEFTDLRRGMRCRYKWDEGTEDIIILDYGHPKNRIEFINASMVDRPESTFNPNDDGSIITIHHEKFGERFSQIPKN